MKEIDDIFSELESSLIKIEILIFFSRNNYFMDTAHKISQLLKRPLVNITRELNTLARNGIIERIGEGENSIYSFTGDIEIIKRVEEFIKNIATRRIV